MKRVQAIRGMRDVFAPELRLLDHIVERATSTAKMLAYVRVPLSVHASALEFNGTKPLQKILLLAMLWQERVTTPVVEEPAVFSRTLGDGLHHLRIVHCPSARLVTRWHNPRI